MSAPLTAIQAIGANPAVNPLNSIDRPMASNTTAAASPVDWLSQQIHAADTQIKTADAGVQQLALGRDVELHRVMLDIEQARLSFDLVVQVRNRLVEAYQDIVRLQI